MIDVVVAGDGPAAAAVVHACRERTLEVIAVGPTTSWPHTYGMWRDEVPHLPDTCFTSVTAATVVRARTERVLPRPYAVIDPVALRRHLGIDAVRRHGRIVHREDAGDRVLAHLDDGEVLAARWLVDATGRVAAGAWQTAYGVVVSDAHLARAGYSTTHATVMGWLPRVTPPCFVYAVPVRDGWLVQVTVLVARPAVEPSRLRRVLVDVLGEAPVLAAEALGRVETVRIPMDGTELPPPGGRIVPFGVAGGLGHPATGYSVAASLTFADRLAGAIADGRDPIDAMWRPTIRRARELHEAGRDVLLRLDPDGLVDFFEAFFSTDLDRWADYLRVDVDTGRVTRAMWAVFRAAPWSVRRRLLGVDPRLARHLLRVRPH